MSSQFLGILWWESWFRCPVRCKYYRFIDADSDKILAARQFTAFIIEALAVNYWYNCLIFCIYGYKLQFQLHDFSWLKKEQPNIALHFVIFGCAGDNNETILT